MASKIERRHLKVGILAIVILLTVLFHYGVLYSHESSWGHVFHAIHGRLCYVPIILAGIWFGLRGGVLAALLLSLLVLPYALRLATRESHELASELTEIFFYVGIGILTGVLTEIQRKERDKKESLARQLEGSKRLSELGEMAAGIAHEIKNPLGSIRGAAEILGDEFDQAHPKREFVDILVRESKRLEGSLDSFLSYARTPPGKLKRQHLKPLVESVVKQASLEAESQNASIVLRSPESGAFAIVDETKIRQVLLNLIKNALESFDEGIGMIEIFLRSNVTSPRAPGKTFVSITIRDDGAGVPAEDFEKVFVPFYTTKRKGTGLGLAISFKIIEEHAGLVSMESEPGKGTSVEILLPEARP